jgi:hypothetical protein
MNTQYQQRRGQETQTRDELDLYEQAINAVAGDDFLETNQLGLGNLHDEEMWQQIESYKSGMYGEAAFGGLIDDMLVEQTKRELARQKWEELGETEEERWKQMAEDMEYPSKRRWIEQKAEQCWERLKPDRDVGDAETRREVQIQKQVQEIIDKTGRPPGWTPPHWRMLLMRLASSRSRDSRLIDHPFDRVTVEYVSGDIDPEQALGGVR